MTILFEEEVLSPFSFDYREIVRMVIETTLDTEKFPYDIEVGVTLTDDTHIHKMNREFRGVDRPTDVLSFPLLEIQQPFSYEKLEKMEDVFHPETGEAMLGDIVVSVEHVVQQAKSYDHSTKREFGFLIAHSMLHLLGYDHIEVDDANIMEKKQSNILDLLNITREERKNV